VAYRALQTEVGLEPEAILAFNPKKLARVIAEGGMLANHRAEKMRECARVVQKIGGVDVLRDAMKGDVGRAHKILRRFPSVGEPGADRILLLLHRKKTIAPDSNALRVLQRTGLVKELSSYSKTYRAAETALKRKLPSGFPTLITTHQLLKAHGQAMCSRTTPSCNTCPLDRKCAKRGLE
jgi:endonuclease III